MTIGGLRKPKPLFPKQTDMTMMTSQMIDPTVGRLHVEVDGDGPPAMLWHSLFVDSGSWARMRPLLRDERRLIVVDGPGHGRSSTPPGDFRLDDCAQAAAEVMDASDVSKPVDWVGNAWGGHVGLSGGLPIHRCGPPDCKRCRPRHARPGVHPDAAG
jgi:alpha/beta hydrolase fold